MGSRFGTCTLPAPQIRMTLSEAKTRALHIDPQLRAADWKLNDRTQVRLEVPVAGYDAEPWNDVTDSQQCILTPALSEMPLVRH